MILAWNVKYGDRWEGDGGIPYSAPQIDLPSSSAS